jgi:outer membrane lipopolysaccharide assembly protein LptE/RlpB
MKYLSLLFLVFLLAGCWPSSVGFNDTGGMPEEWKSFHILTLQNNAPTCPLNYPAVLTEAIKDGVQNNTRLSLATKNTDAQVQMEGVIQSYSVSPIALQNGDNAAKNRLTLTLQFTVNTTVPKAEQIQFNVTRFADFDASTNLAAVESELLTTLNEQIVQDIINKLTSNW